MFFEKTFPPWHIWGLKMCRWTTHTSCGRPVRLWLLCLISDLLCWILIFLHYIVSFLSVSLDEQIKLELNVSQQHSYDVRTSLLVRTDPEQQLSRLCDTSAGHCEPLTCWRESRVPHCALRVLQHRQLFHVWLTTSERVPGGDFQREW